MSGSRHKRFDPMTSIKANFEEHLSVLSVEEDFKSESKCVTSPTQRILSKYVRFH